MVSRKTSNVRDLKAGCFDCFGSDAHWFGPNAQGVAAKHHDSTGHSTWVDVRMTVYYGNPVFDENEARKELPGLW